MQEPCFSVSSRFCLLYSPWNYISQSHPPTGTRVTQPLLLQSIPRLCGSLCSQMLALGSLSLACKPHRSRARHRGLCHPYYLGCYEQKTLEPSSLGEIPVAGKTVSWELTIDISTPSASPLRPSWTCLWDCGNGCQCHPLVGNKDKWTEAETGRRTPDKANEDILGVSIIASRRLILEHRVSWISQQTLSTPYSSLLDTASQDTRILPGLYENKEWWTRKLMITINACVLVTNINLFSPPTNGQTSIDTVRKDHRINNQANLTELRSGFKKTWTRWK